MKWYGSLHVKSVAIDNPRTEEDLAERLQQLPSDWGERTSLQLYPDRYLGSRELLVEQLILVALMRAEEFIKAHVNNVQDTQPPNDLRPLWPEDDPAAYALAIQALEHAPYIDGETRAEALRIAHDRAEEATAHWLEGLDTMLECEADWCLMGGHDHPLYEPCAPPRATETSEHAETAAQKDRSARGTSA